MISPGLWKCQLSLLYKTRLVLRTGLALQVKLSLAMKPLDECVPTTKSGKDLIVWTEEMLSAFKTIQSILKSPNTITVPREGDSLHIASDFAASLPAAGTKMIIERPGVEGFLLSFNFGYRVSRPMLSWSSCELEAHGINKAINQHNHFIRLTGKPAITNPCVSGS